MPIYILYIVSFLISLLICIGLAFIPANIAKKKGRNAVGYFFFGLFAFIPALIVANCVSNLNEAA